MQRKSLLLVYKYPILLFILISSVILANFIWLRKDALPPVGNGLQDLFPGIYFYSDIKHNDFTLKDFLTIFNSFSLTRHFFSAAVGYIKNLFVAYPPLAPLSYASTYLLFGPDSGMELMANSLYLAVALLAIYGIGKYLFNRKAGLLAAFIFASFPGVISISREVYSEFIMSCLLAAALYFLLRTDFFRSRKYSILFGIFLSLTALAKWEFPPALIGPFLLILWKAGELARLESWEAGQKKRFWINLLSALFVTMIIASVWYVPCFGNIIKRLFFNPAENILNNNPTTFNSRIFSIQTLTYYPLAVINTHIRFFYFLTLLLVTGAFIYKFIKKKVFLNPGASFSLLFLGSWIIIPYFFFSFIKIHAPSHIMLILPAIAVVISAGIFSFYNRITRVVFISLVFLYGLGSFLHSFLSLEGLRPVYNLKIFVDDRNKLSLTAGDGYYMRDDWEKWGFRPPDSRDWKIQEALSYIKADNSKLKYKPVVLVLSQAIHQGGRIHLQSFQFEYYNLLNNYRLCILPIGNERVTLPEDRSKFDYVIINTMSTDLINEGSLKNLARHTPNIGVDFKINSFAADFSKKYSLVREYPLPDNYVSRIYKLINEK